MFTEMVSHTRRTDREILISFKYTVDERINGRRVSLMCAMLHYRWPGVRQDIKYCIQEIRMFKFSSSLKAQKIRRPLALVIFILSALLLTGCGGTKVYKNDKTIAYNGSIYNLSNVMQTGTINTGKLSNDETVNLKGADRKQIEAYLKESGSMYVRMAFDFDGKEMLYRASSVTKWSEYSSMLKKFEKAGKDITSLMANKKKMQLKLK